VDERRKRKNVNTEKGRKNYRKLRNELKKSHINAKKEYLENICNEIMEYQRTGRYDLMYRLEGDPRDSKYWHRRFPRE